MKRPLSPAWPSTAPDERQVASLARSLLALPDSNAKEASQLLLQMAATAVCIFVGLKILLATAVSYQEAVGNKRTVGY